jgi:hypothetical protein
MALNDKKISEYIMNCKECERKLSFLFKVLTCRLSGGNKEGYEKCIQNSWSLDRYLKSGLRRYKARALHTHRRYKFKTFKNHIYIYNIFNLINDRIKIGIFSFISVKFRLKN